MPEQPNRSRPTTTIAPERTFNYPEPIHTIHVMMYHSVRARPWNEARLQETLGWKGVYQHLRELDSIYPNLPPCHQEVLCPASPNGLQPTWALWQTSWVPSSEDNHWGTHKLQTCLRIYPLLCFKIYLCTIRKVLWVILACDIVQWLPVQLSVCCIHVAFEIFCRGCRQRRWTTVFYWQTFCLRGHRATSTRLR